MSFNLGEINLGEYADFGDHPTECFQDPSQDPCTNGVSVMVSVYMRTLEDQFFAGTDTELNVRGFEIYMEDSQIKCNFFTSNQRYEVSPGHSASINSQFINESIDPSVNNKYINNNLTCQSNVVIVVTIML